MALNKKPKPKVELALPNTADELMAQLLATEMELAACATDLTDTFADARQQVMIFAIPHLQAKQKLLASLEAWWKENRPTGDGAAKSITLQCGVVGSRSGRKSVKLLRPEAEIIAAIDALENERVAARGKVCVVQPPRELNRSIILALGFTLEGFIEISDGEESFFAEPAIEEIRDEAPKRSSTSGKKAA